MFPGLSYAQIKEAETAASSFLLQDRPKITISPVSPIGSFSIDFDQNMLFPNSKDTDFYEAVFKI